MSARGTEPVLTPLGERLRERTQPLAPADADYGYAHAYLCEAIGRMFQQVGDVFDPEGDLPPLAPILDLDLCPDWALPWLGQLTGVVLPKGVTPDQARSFIREVAGFQRGTPAAMRAAAQLFLTGDKSVQFRERDPSGADPPYTLEVVVKTSELPASDRGEPINLVTNPSSEVAPALGNNSTATSTPINLATNPSGEAGAPTFTTFSTSSSGKPAATVADTTAWAAVGTHATRYTVTRDDASALILRTATGTAGIPVIAGHWYALRLTAHIQSISTANSLTVSRVTAYWYTAAGGGATPASSPGATNGPLAVGAAGDAYLIVQAPADAAFLAVAYGFNSSQAIVGSQFVVDADALMVVDLGTTAPPSSGQTTQPQDVPLYFDGSQPGYKWDGTANASTSSPTATRTRVNDWAAPGAGSWSMRYSVVRDDASQVGINTVAGTNQGTGGKYAVVAGHYYALRARVRARPTCAELEAAQMGAMWYQPDNATFISYGYGPRVPLRPGTQADVVLIAQPVDGAGWLALRAVLRPANAFQSLIDVDVDALALYDLGTDFAGGTGTGTDPADVPPYFDGDTAGSVWNGTAHASTSHPVPTTKVQDALLAVKPGGIVLNYRAIVGWDYQQQTAQGGLYSAQSATYPTYRRLSEGP